MKSVQICGIGNALVDLSCHIDEPSFREFSFERGTVRLVTPEEQRQIISSVSKITKPQLSCGGSVANSIVAYAQLGGRASFICLLGKDQFGTFYENEFSRLEISTNKAHSDEGDTGTCVALITPDAERTLRTCLGVSARLSDKEVPFSLIKKSEWLFIEGYLLGSRYGPDAIKRAIEYAERGHTKIALTLSEKTVARQWRHEFEGCLEKVDMLFANASEALSFTGARDVDSAMRALKQVVKGAAVTLGGDGAWVFARGEEARVPAAPCVPVDTTGAGDMFAGAFLRTFTEGRSVEEAARIGCFLSAKVISQYGARLKGDVRALLEKGGASNY